MAAIFLPKQAVRKLRTACLNHKARNSSGKGGIGYGEGEYTQHGRHDGESAEIFRQHQKAYRENGRRPSRNEVKNKPGRGVIPASPFTG